MSCLANCHSANVIGPGLPADIPQKFPSDTIIFFMKPYCSWSNLSGKLWFKFWHKHYINMLGGGDGQGEAELPFPTGSSSHATTGTIITPLPISIISVASLASSRLIFFISIPFKPGTAPSLINCGTSSKIRLAVHPDKIFSKEGTSRFPCLLTNATFMFWHSAMKPSLSSQMPA